jgi:hypothetical protein
MCLTTLHFLMNMARAKNCGWQLQGHFDGSFKFCEKSIAMLGFGMGSLGAHFNPVCFAITNDETAEAFEWTYRAFTESLYTAFDLIKPCVGPVCGHELCTLIKEHDRGAFNTLRRNIKKESIKRNMKKESINTKRRVSRKRSSVPSSSRRRTISSSRSLQQGFSMRILNSWLLQSRTRLPACCALLERTALQRGSSGTGPASAVTTPTHRPAIRATTTPRASNLVGDT